MGEVHASVLVNSCHQKTVWKSENIGYTWRVSPNERVISVCLLRVLVRERQNLQTIPSSSPFQPPCLQTLPIQKFGVGLGFILGVPTLEYPSMLKGSFFRENSQKGSRPRVQNCSRTSWYSSSEVQASSCLEDSDCWCLCFPG